MDIDERKLYNFERLIIADAEAKSEEILNAARQEKEKNVKQARAELESKYDKRLSRETLKIDKEENEKIASLQAGYKKEILSLREQLIDSIFQKVVASLSEYIKTDSYRESMKAKIYQALMEMSDDTVLIINENDEQLKQAGYRCETTPQQFYGGCKIIDNKNGIQIDMTNKSKMEKLRNTFLEQHNLKL